MSKKQQDPAKSWEKAYIEFMKNYIAEKMDECDCMEIAFSAERSIEDELSRQSESDIFTVALSYLIMFAYIALALGEQNSLKRLAVSPS